MKGSVAAVYCEFKYSGVADGLLAGAAFATAALVAAMPLAIAVKAFLGLFVLALACRAARAVRRVRAIRVDGGRGICVEDPGGKRRTGAVCDGSFVCPWLTIVRWRPNGAWLDRTVLVLPGMLNPDAFRILRVILRWG